MTRGQARRALRRILRWARTEIGDAGEFDPLTGGLIGAMHAEEALACGRAVMGPHSYGTYRVRATRGNAGQVIIGDYCSIADGVDFVLGGNHRPDWVSTFPFRLQFGMEGAWTDGHPRPDPGTVVGNDVWIGTDCLILPGINIGDGAIVAAGSVVTRDVEPYTIVGGAPARPIRKRFSDEQIAALLELRWWDWPEAQVRAHVDLLCSPDVDELIAAGRRLTAAAVPSPGPSDS